MPFTAAHPAAIVPLLVARRPWLSAPGLVAGSMAPDFEYFLRAKMYGVFGHTWPGLLVFCLPVGLVLVAVYERLLFAPLAVAAPDWLRSRLFGTPPERAASLLRQLVVVGASVLIGAASHLVWDAFTHASGLPVQHWALLRHPVPLPVVGPVLVFKLLQQASTAVGLVVVLWAIARIAPRSVALSVRPDVVRKARFALALATMSGASALVGFRFLIEGGYRAGAHGHFIVAAISGSMLGALVGCIGIRLALLSRHHVEGPGASLS